MKIKMDYKWVAVRYRRRHFMAALDRKHRGDRAPDILAEFERQYRGWGMDNHRLQAHADNTSGYARAVG